jgi:hypothetical protein
MRNTKFLSENLTERDHADDFDVDGKMKLELILGNSDKVWSGCIWLGIGINGGLLTKVLNLRVA